MLKELLQLEEDVNGYDLFDESKLDNAGGFEIGTRIFWYYNEDVDYFQATADDMRKYSNDIYSGTCIPWVGYEYRGGEIDFDKVVVIIDQMPSEKEYPNIAWVSIKRLLYDEDLVEIFTKRE